MTYYKTKDNSLEYRGFNTKVYYCSPSNIVGYHLTSQCFQVKHTSPR